MSKKKKNSQKKSNKSALKPNLNIVSNEEVKNESNAEIVNKEENVIAEENVEKTQENKVEATKEVKIKSQDKTEKVVEVKAKDVKKKKEKDKPKKPNKVAKAMKDTGNELKRVEWPKFKQVVKQTSVVLVFVIVFALVLFGFDRLCSWLTSLLV